MSADSPAGETAPPSVLREPSAIVVLGNRLYIANRRSGTVSVVDPADRAVLGETRLGTGIADLVPLPDQQALVALDEAGDEVLLLSIDADILQVMSRVKVAKSPVTACVSKRNHLVTVTSLWARRLTLIQCALPAPREDRLTRSVRSTPPSPAAGLQVLATIDLPFSPREQCLTPDESRLIVADAFGGKLAVIDLAAREIVSLHTIDAHNLRGLTVNAATNELAVAHQALMQHLSTTRDHIFWGNIVGNFVKSIPLDDLVRSPAITRNVRERRLPATVDSHQVPPEGDTASDVYRRIAHWSLDALGGPGKAAGDPGAIALTDDEKMIVALSGVDQIAFRSGPNKPFIYLPVGARPVALALSADQETCFVANALDDTVSIVDVKTAEVVGNIPLGPRRDLSSAEEGERLFYNARLSLHGWYSCHSCHPEGHTIGLLNDNLGDELYGDPKRIPSLLGTGGTAPWGWSGSKQTLADQIHGSLLNTMHGGDAAGRSVAGDETVAPLEAYLRTLVPPPSIAAARGTPASPAAERGRKIFESRGCTSCHAPPHFTSARTYDVGIHDKSGQTKFNPPSLRGVIHRGPFFHDNRAASLRDVFTRFHHGDTDDISPADLDDLLKFLAGL